MLAQLNKAHRMMHDVTGACGLRISDVRTDDSERLIRHHNRRSIVAITMCASVICIGRLMEMALTGQFALDDDMGMFESESVCFIQHCYHSSRDDIHLALAHTATVTVGYTAVFVL
jgi:hypothetical protein